jgi:trk system potassium uptake protein TrkA
VAEKVVVAGAGTTGFQVAKHLIADHKDVVLIEKNAATAKYAVNHLDCLVINDSGNNLRALREAGIEKADFFISVTDSDEFNIVSCGLVASEFRVPCKIARVRNPDYTKSSLSDRSFLDVDYFVNPEVEAANAIVKSVEQGATSDVMQLENTNLQMRNLLVTGDGYFANKSIADIKAGLDSDFLVAGITRGEEFFVPSGQTMVETGDELFLVAAEDSLEHVFQSAGRPRVQLKKIIIVGGGRVGSYVARELTSNNGSRGRRRFLSYLGMRQKHLKIVDTNYENCKDLAERFPEATVINSDISEEGFFEEETLMGYDLIITTTDNPELNILVAIYAKTFGIKRSIAVVNKYNYLAVASRLGADVIISPKNSVVNTILKFIRRGRVKSVRSVFGGMAEVIESTLDGSRGFVGKAIRELKMPESSLVVSVTRAGEHSVPRGDFQLEDGDKLTVLARTESIARVEEMFNS